MKCACFERLLEVLLPSLQFEPMPLVYHSLYRIGKPCFTVRATPGVLPCASPLDLRLGHKMTVIGSCGRSLPMVMTLFWQLPQSA